MSDPWSWTVSLAAAYLLGAVPFGVIIAKYVSGVDVRSVGSGGTGATNVARSSGKKAGIAALLLDGGKGAVAILIAKQLADGQPHLVEALAGILVIVGHNWPVFTGFKGGKGIAAGWAALTVISPWASLAAAVVALPVVGISRYVSLGSIVGTLAGLIFLILQIVAFDYGGPGYFLYIGIGGFLVIWRHSANIKRLLNSEENKLGRRVKMPDSETAQS